MNDKNSLTHLTIKSEVNKTFVNPEESIRGKVHECGPMFKPFIKSTNNLLVIVQ